MPSLRIEDGRSVQIQDIAGVQVSSSGGVPPVYAALAPKLFGKRVLDYGSWQGIAGLFAVRGGAEVTCAHYLSSQLAQAKHNFDRNDLNCSVQAMFPISGSWDSIILEAPEVVSALEMLVGQARGALAPGGRLLVVDRHGSDRLKDEAKTHASGADWALYGLDSLGNGESLPWQQFWARVRGLELKLWSLPGMFSPQRLDAGTALMLSQVEISAGGRVLDLGAGSGVAGITAARLGAGEVVFIDDDLIALTACRRNLDSLGLAAPIYHSHLPGAIRGNFDLVLTNPPYHSEYGVPRSFLEFAHRNLTCGGWLWVVVKKPDWYQNKLEHLFGGYKLIQADGYSLLGAKKKEFVHKKAPGKGTTKKHLRRQVAARGRRGK